MLPLVAAISLMSSTPAGEFLDPPNPPTVNISAVRGIECDGWRGSGFLIGDKIMATALHVVLGGKNCHDVDTGGKLLTYKLDIVHDLALVTSSTLPTNIPYIKISCAHYKKDQPYIAYGRTSYGMGAWENVIVRSNTVYGTGNYDDVTLRDGSVMKHAAILSQWTAPGMSGGPITNLNGYALSVVNAGDSWGSLTHEFADGMLCN